MIQIKFIFKNFIYWQRATGIGRRRWRLWLAAAACSRLIQ